MVVGTWEYLSNGAALSHVFAERPFPPNLSQDHQDNAVSVVAASASANDNSNSFQDYGSSTTLPLLLNTNQVEWKKKSTFLLL